MTFLCIVHKLFRRSSLFCKKTSLFHTKTCIKLQQKEKYLLKKSTTWTASQSLKSSPFGNWTTWKKRNYWKMSLVSLKLTGALLFANWFQNSVKLGLVYEANTSKFQAGIFSSVWKFFLCRKKMWNQQQNSWLIDFEMKSRSGCYLAPIFLSF